MITEIPYQTHTEWLEQRRRYIGGSDEAAVVGLNPYKSPYTLWAEKTGRAEAFAGNLTTRVGSYLEDLVATLFTEKTGKKVYRKNSMLVNEKYPFACGDVDRMVRGERALLEMKTTSSLPTMKKVKGGDYPEAWYCQMTHYLAVTAYDKAYLAVLVGNKDFYTFELARDEAEIECLMNAEEKFYAHILKDTPPEPDGSSSCRDTLEKLYSESDNTSVTLFGRERILDEYQQLRASRAQTDERLTAIENILKSDMGQAETAYCGGYQIRWKNQTRKTFSARDFAAAHKNMDLSPYYRMTTCRAFSVTGNG